MIVSHYHIDDACKCSFWYTEVSAYYVYNLMYLCRSLFEQEIELVLNIADTATPKSSLPDTE